MTFEQLLEREEQKEIVHAVVEDNKDEFLALAEFNYFGGENE